jgi:outer membrane protein assembly factor BamE (lipoprotein component of BamABCDE complex)
MKSFQKEILAVVLGIGLVFFWGYSHTESYCFFYPSIDTHYAPGYSEAAFDQITTGMTSQAVLKLLGSPLHSDTNKDASVRWCYTSDGKAIYGDWAWFGREIIFQDNKVAVVEKILYND